MADSDKPDVISFLDFGWCLAELRGRWRQQLVGMPVPVPQREKRTDYALPLNRERSSGELQFQASKQLQYLASALRLDRLTLPESEELGARTSGGSLLVDPAALLCYFEGRFWSKAPAASGPSPEVDAHAQHALWNQIAHFFYMWDAAIQDELIERSFKWASAYQLGRGLAESFWGLQPAAEAKAVGSWCDLLGPERQAEFKQMIVQLSPPLEPLSASALKGSLAIWALRIRDHAVGSSQQSLDALHRQIQRWHLVLVEGVPVQAFVDDTRLSDYAGQSVSILKAFAWQIVTATAGILVSAAAVAILVNAGSNRALGGLLAVLGLFGVTGAGLLARAKAAANASFAKLRQALDEALAADALTIRLPKRPRAGS